MNISIIAKQLNISSAVVQKESIKNFLERKFLETKTEIFVLANKYGAETLKEFDCLIKKGKIHETSDSREDFFKLDYLESKLQTLQKLIKSL